MHSVVLYCLLFIFLLKKLKQVNIINKTCLLNFKIKLTKQIERMQLNVKLCVYKALIFFLNKSKQIKNKNKQLNSKLMHEVRKLLIFLFNCLFVIKKANLLFFFSMKNNLYLTVGVLGKILIKLLISKCFSCLLNEKINNLIRLINFVCKKEKKLNSFFDLN
jgi:hypothetical protein